MISVIVAIIMTDTKTSCSIYRTSYSLYTLFPFQPNERRTANQRVRDDQIFLPQKMAPHIQGVVTQLLPYIMLAFVSTHGGKPRDFIPDNVTRVNAAGDRQTVSRRTRMGDQGLATTSRLGNPDSPPQLHLSLYPQYRPKRRRHQQHRGRVRHERAGQAKHHPGCLPSHSRHLPPVTKPSLHQMEKHALQPREGYEGQRIMLHVQSTDVA